MRPRSFATATVLTAAVLIAACGDDDTRQSAGEDDTAAFLLAADEICTDAAADVVAINTELGIPQSTDEAVELGEQVLASREEHFDELSNLEPPSQVNDAYQAFLDARADAIAANEAQVAADRKQDLEAGQAALAEYDDALGAADDAAAEAGLAACAGVLGEEDAAEIELLAEAGLLADNPEDLEDVCAATTEDFLEAIGGLEECLNPTPADSVETLEVTGISDITAEARVEVTGGPLDGETVLVIFDHLDGEWKVAGIQPV